MSKKVNWKWLLIVILVAIAGWNVYPPKYKLKAGIDIGGGTSLIYDIDTSDLSKEDQKGLAQRMIPILLKRVDPANVANTMMRPQGDTRIEIQLPGARLDTVAKRKAYDVAIEELEKVNVNLLAVKRALSLPADRRKEALAAFAMGNDSRTALLEELVGANDQLQAKQTQRDRLDEKNKDLKSQIEQAGLMGSLVEARTAAWSKMADKELAAAIAEYVKDRRRPSDPNAPVDAAKNAQDEKLIADYVAAYKSWAVTVNELAAPETGINARWSRVAARLSELNLDTTGLTDILEMDIKSADRADRLKALREKFPERAELIDKAVSAYAEYSVVGGRLDDPEDLKRMLRGAGVLEFRILPIMGDGKANESELQARLQELQEKGPNLASSSKYVWCEIEDAENFRRDAVVGQFGEKFYVLASNQKNECMLHEGQSPWKLKKARPSVDQMGRRAIAFALDTAAGKMFFNVTKNNINRPLCILLDGVAFSAPDVNTAISDSGIIEGDFSQTEQDIMVNKLNAGSFPARLSQVPISEKSIGPAIGAENRDQGIRAGLIGLAAVIAFMLVYYLAAGSIADVALLMNILFILGMMAMLRATFTLPGIAGLILTIGMSVDANVLIFERIREEQDRGSSIRTALANGYQRAFRTIFDSNITTFFVALVLYMVASEEIKGFAIVLMLGIASSMFTALFVTRVFFDFLLAKGVIKGNLAMLRLIRNANINWMSLRLVFCAVSLLLIAGGMFVFFTRDETVNSKYDIEFTGGTSVQIKLKPEFKNLTRNDVERIFKDTAKAISSELSAATVYSIGESGLEYEISTTETNLTTATVTFKEPGQTVVSVTVAIESAADAQNAILYNLQVSQTKEGAFTVATSQVNKALVAGVLSDAFADKATISEPQVDEIVSRAVRDAFAGKLDVRENLEAAITSAEKISADSVELQNFLGGVKITVDLAREALVKEIQDRLNEIRFKPDSQDLARYPYDVLSTGLAQLKDDESVKSFVYVSVHPEAGYRELDENEWDRYVRNEEDKITRATSMQTTLARVTQIDPSIGGQAKKQAMVAIVLSLVAIVAYIWMRFGTARYGFAAIIALVHDVCITLGAVTVCYYLAGTSVGKALLLADFKINLQMIAAFLTIIGYSLNDTIVVFDRIRENRGKLSSLSPQLINNSINQTLSRTLLTSFTTFLVVFVMYIWGGTGLRGFTFAMLVGIIIGTYSSIAIAAPILILGGRRRADKLEK